MGYNLLNIISHHILLCDLLNLASKTIQYIVCAHSYLLIIINVQLKYQLFYVEIYLNSHILELLHLIKILALSLPAVCSWISIDLPIK